MKTNKSAGIALFGVFFNLVMWILYGLGLLFIYHDDKNGTAVDVLPKIHQILFWSSICLMPLIVPFYIISVFMNPGYLEKKYDYEQIIDKALENSIPLENFCSYD